VFEGAVDRHVTTVARVGRQDGLQAYDEATRMDDGSNDTSDQVDARFLLANERTFLAWNRTALGFAAAGLAVAKLLGAGDSALVAVSGLVLVAIGALVGVVAVRRWRANIAAMRAGRELEHTTVPYLLTIGLVVGSVLFAVVILVE
jgi:putative membrane protein